MIRHAPIRVLATALACWAAAATSGASALGLCLPHTVFGAFLALKPAARDGFVALGPAAVVGLFVLGGALAYAGAGLLRRQRAAHLLLVALVGVNALSDLVRLVLEPGLEALVPVLIAPVVLIFLLTPTFRVWTGRSRTAG